jgi:hypothetical protein
MFVERKMPASGPRTQKQMAAEQISKKSRHCHSVSVNVLSNACASLDRVKIPQDFIDALEDFEKERFVSTWSRRLM